MSLSEDETSFAEMFEQARRVDAQLRAEREARRYASSAPPDLETLATCFGDRYTEATPGARSAVHWLMECIALLLQKNAAYGDSALSPIRVFSRADAVEQIKVRLDDKISRLARGNPTAQAAIPEDTRRDIVNYLALLHAAEEAGRE